MLGLNNSGSVQNFVQQGGGKTFGKFDVPRGSFDEQIRSAMDQADELRFNLDGVDLSRINGRLNDFGEPVGGYTNYELFLIRSKPDYLNKTKFYRNGQLVDSPF